MLSILMTAFQQDDSGAAAASLGSTLCSLVIAVIVIAGLWKVFTKAGQPGWAAIIPIYNYYILLKIAGKPGWWLLLLIIPFVNFVIMILTMIDLAKAFGKGTGFALGLIFLSPIFIPLLGFGDAKYIGIEGSPRPVIA
ncbi:MAG TPA: DUF5684 domain-containing protein [Roseiflexaceae bacterium]|nr:DUF5684 domain-containing protein [Roseiflexaceae bacterium]